MVRQQIYYVQLHSSIMIEIARQDTSYFPAIKERLKVLVPEWHKLLKFSFEIWMVKQNCAMYQCGVTSICPTGWSMAHDEHFDIGCPSSLFTTPMFGPGYYHRYMPLIDVYSTTDAPSANGYCGDPNPNAAGEGDYKCPAGKRFKYGMNYASRRRVPNTSKCTNVQECNCNCCCDNSSNEKECAMSATCESLVVRRRRTRRRRTRRRAPPTPKPPPLPPIIDYPSHR